LPAHTVAGTQPKAANLGLGNVDVVCAGKEPLASQEPKAILDDLKDAVSESVAVSLCLCLEQPRDQIRFAKSQIAGDRKFLGQLVERFVRPGVEFRNRQPVGIRHRLAHGLAIAVVVSIGGPVAGMARCGLVARPAG
jgi:hypothetical protein